jgi:kynurenine formamidase
MQMVLWVIPIALALRADAGAQPAPRVVDLGHPLAADSPSWSGDPAFRRSATATIEKDGYAGGSFTTDEHFGTHLDAPSHFGGEWTTEKIPVDRLVRPAVCVNVEAKVAGNDDYRVSVEDLKAFEAAHGASPEGAIVLVATGWDTRWPGGRYMNARDGTRHFPGLSREAGDYLARVRQVVGIGIDTPSVDHGASTTFETHRATQAANVYHIENAAHLTQLPPTGFTVVVAPINIAGGSGGPTRMFALLPAAR